MEESAMISSIFDSNSEETDVPDALSTNLQVRL